MYGLVGNVIFSAIGAMSVLQDLKLQFPSLFICHWVHPNFRNKVAAVMLLRVERDVTAADWWRWRWRSNDKSRLRPFFIRHRDIDKKQRSLQYS